MKSEVSDLNSAIASINIDITESKNQLLHLEVSEKEMQRVAEMSK